MDINEALAFSSASQLDALNKIQIPIVNPVVHTTKAIYESMEENRQNTVAAIEANKQLSDASIQANKEISDQGIRESKRSSSIALWIAIPSLLLTVGSLLFAYWDSKESKVWMESELIELKTTNTKLESLNVGYSATIELQKRQLQELKTLSSELNHQKNK